jgi:hypothetical protein
MVDPRADRDARGESRRPLARRHGGSRPDQSVGAGLEQAPRCHAHRVHRGGDAPGPPQEVGTHEAGCGQDGGLDRGGAGGRRGHREPAERAGVQAVGGGREGQGVQGPDPRDGSERSRGRGEDAAGAPPAVDRPADPNVFLPAPIARGDPRDARVRPSASAPAASLARTPRRPPRVARRSPGSVPPTPRRPASRSRALSNSPRPLLPGGGT